MAGPVSDTYKLEYQRLVELAVQQKASRFEESFTFTADLKGRVMQVLDLIEPTTAIVNPPRGGDSPNIEANHEPVWVKPTQIIWGKLIEIEDYIKALTDYEGVYVSNGAAAIVRGRDLNFATSLFGSRLIGLDSATVSAYNNPQGTVANTVGSADGATTVGMNIRKINRAFRLFNSAYVEVDYEDVWGVLNAQGHEELINDTLTINTDYAKMMVLDENKRRVRYLAGVNWVSYESVPDIDANNFCGGMWCKSGMRYGDFYPLTTNAAPNPQKNFRIQTHMENWWGSTRTEDLKAVKISNFKNPVGPNG